MKNLYPVAKRIFFQYGLTIFLLTVFLAGIYFIFWMGKSSEWTEMEDELTELRNKVVDFDASPSPSSNDLETEDLIQAESTDMCPTLLIKRGKQLMLFNKNLPEIPKQNPIFFENLEQYIAYVKVQRDVYNQTCPVLFLQEETNTQGEEVYRMRQPNSNDITVDPLMLGSAGDYFQNATKVAPKFMPPSGPKAHQSVNLALYGSTNVQSTNGHPPTVPYLDANRKKPYNQGTYGFDPSSQYVGKYTVLDKIHDSTKTQNPDGLSDNAMDSGWGGAVFTADKIRGGKYAGNSVEPPTVVSNLKFGDYPEVEDKQSIPTSNE